MAAIVLQFPKAYVAYFNEFCALFGVSPPCEAQYELVGHPPPARSPKTCSSFKTIFTWVIERSAKAGSCLFCVFVIGFARIFYCSCSVCLECQIIWLVISTPIFFIEIFVVLLRWSDGILLSLFFLLLLSNFVCYQFGLFLFHKFSNFTPPPAAPPLLPIFFIKIAIILRPPSRWPSQTPCRDVAH